MRDDVQVGQLVELVDFDPARLDELVTLWRASFEAGVGMRDPHPIAEQKQYLLNQVLPSNRVRMAVVASELVGFVAASDESVSQLFVRVGVQQRGIGRRMLDWAKQQSAGRLWLYTFARNAGARSFYERNGFVPIAFGFEPIWQLKDVRYCWPAPPPAT